MKLLILLRGLPGCGKTTFAKELEESMPGCKIISADDYFTSLEDGSYNFEASKLGVAHIKCQSRVERAMRINVSKIIVHNTSTTPQEMEPYYDMAKNSGYMVVSLIVENRHGSTSVHNVPEDTLLKMRNRFDVQL
jgi:predicted kinase